MNDRSKKLIWIDLKQGCYYAQASITNAKATAVNRRPLAAACAASALFCVQI